MPAFVAQVAVGEKKMSKYSLTGQSFITMATQLSEELANISIISNYKSAQGKLNADGEAMELIRKLTAARQELYKKQTTGAFTPESLNDYYNIQNEAEKNSTIMEYSFAQQEAVQFLKNVNFEISQLIGIDFSSLIKRSNTC